MNMKILLGALTLLLMFTSSIGYAAGWREDFERLCATTEQAETMSTDELKKVVEEVDQLREVIEKEGGQQKKLYLFRLQKCRSFFEYMLSTKESEQVRE